MVLLRTPLFPVPSTSLNVRSRSLVVMTSSLVRLSSSPSLPNSSSTLVSSLSPSPHIITLATMTVVTCLPKSSSRARKLARAVLLMTWSTPIASSSRLLKLAPRVFLLARASILTTLSLSNMFLLLAIPSALSTSITLRSSVVAGRRSTSSTSVRYVSFTPHKLAIQKLTLFIGLTPRYSSHLGLDHPY